MSATKKLLVAIAITLGLVVSTLISFEIFMRCIRPTIVDQDTVYVELFGQVHEYGV